MENDKFKVDNIKDKDYYNGAIEKEKDSKKIKLSETSWKRIKEIEEALIEDNARIEKQIIDVQRQMVTPTSFRQKVRNFFGRNKRLLSTLNEQLYINSDKINDLRKNYFTGSIHRDEEVYNKPINIPEKIVNNAKEMEEELRQKMMEVSLNSIVNESEFKEASDDELNNVVPSIDDSIKNVVSKIDGDAVEAQNIAKAIAGESSSLSDEEDKVDTDRLRESVDSQFTELSNDEEKEEDKVISGPPSIIPSSPASIDFKNMPDIGEMPDTSAYEDTEDIPLSINEQRKIDAENEIDHLADERIKLEEAFDDGQIDREEYEAELANINKHAKTEKGRLYRANKAIADETPISIELTTAEAVASTDDVNDIKSLLDTRRQLDEIEANNNSDLTSLADEVKTGEEAIANKKEELNNLKTEVLAYIENQKQSIEKQNAEKRAYQERIEQNSKASSELDADIEALKGAIKK